jgi:hypothetical protein
VSKQEKTSKDFTPRLLAQSTAKFHINAPTTDIDISDRLFNMDELEYINCTPNSRAHLSAGFTHSPDGKRQRMSINVEDIGGALIVEHYHEAISEKLHCRDNAWVRTTEKFEQYMEAHSVPYEGVQHNFQTAVDAHKRRGDALLRRKH